MANYYESTKTAKIIVAYECSHCRTVIVREGILHALGRTNSKNNASAAAEKAFSDALYAIEHAHEKPFLVSKAYNFEGEVSRDSYSVFSFQGFDQSCPFCKGKEIWQATNDKGLVYDGPDWSGKMRVQTIKGVPEDSRPYLIKSGDDLKDWQEQVIIKQKKQIDAVREEQSQNFAAAQSQLEEYGKQIADIDAMRANIGMEARSVKERIDAMTEDAKKYSLFSGERRAANKEIKVLQKQFDALDREDSTKRFGLDTKKADLLKQKKNLMIQYPGIVGEYNVFNSDGKGLLMAFRFD